MGFVKTHMEKIIGDVILSNTLRPLGCTATYSAGTLVPKQPVELARGSYLSHKTIGSQ